MHKQADEQPRMKKTTRLSPLFKLNKKFSLGVGRQSAAADLNARCVGEGVGVSRSGNVWGSGIDWWAGALVWIGMGGVVVVEAVSCLAWREVYWW